MPRSASGAALPRGPPPIRFEIQRKKPLRTKSGLSTPARSGFLERHSPTKAPRLRSSSQNEACGIGEGLLAAGEIRVASRGCGGPGRADWIGWAASLKLRVIAGPPTHERVLSRVFVGVSTNSKAPPLGLRLASAFVPRAKKNKSAFIGFCYFLKRTNKAVVVAGPMVHSRGRCYERT
jgi:hypothetical protein